MPLIDLQTNLKSLKFPGRAPYVTKDINQPPVYNAVSHELRARVDDVTRLTKMLADRPGAEFIAKQALLQSANPANFNSNKRTIIGRAADTAVSIIKSTARTVGTALAQAAVNRTGTHFILPSPEYYYTSQAAAGQASVGSTVASDIVRTSSQLNKVSRYSYKESINTKAKNIYGTYIEDPNQAPSEASTYAKYIGAVTIPGTGSLEGKYGFAEAKEFDSVGSYDIIASNRTADQLDSLDLVPLVFGKFGGNDLKVFRGFIAGLNDTFQANWAGNQYVGRMEQFYVYTGFSRSLSFSFSVPIFSEYEQPFIYNKVNALVSHTAPEYGTGEFSGIPKGVITELQIGDYLNTAGVLNNIGISIDTDVPWSKGPGEIPLLLPQVLRMQIQFTPIHSKTPQYYSNTLTEDGKQVMPYIANSSKGFTKPGTRKRGDSKQGIVTTTGVQNGQFIID